MSPPILPVKVQEYIIDHNRDSVPALRTCASVSRAWRNRSRPYLLQNVVVRSRRVLDELRADPSLPFLVRSVIIGPKGLFSIRSDPWIPLVAQLPQADCLTLFGQKLNASHPIVLTSLRCSHRAISILQLYNMVIRTQREFLHFLSALPSVRRLTCRQVELSTYETSTAAISRYIDLQSERQFIGSLTVSMNDTCGDCCADEDDIRLRKT